MRPPPMCGLLQPQTRDSGCCAWPLGALGAALGRGVGMCVRVRAHPCTCVLELVCVCTPELRPQNAAACKGACGSMKLWAEGGVPRQRQRALSDPSPVDSKPGEAPQPLACPDRECHWGSSLLASGLCPQTPTSQPMPWNSPHPPPQHLWDCSCYRKSQDRNGPWSGAGKGTAGPSAGASSFACLTPGSPER